jgi:hypothetical protein
VDGRSEDSLADLRFGILHTGALYSCTYLLAVLSSHFLDVLTTVYFIVHHISFLAYDHANDERARGYEQALALGSLWSSFVGMLHCCIFALH